MIWVFLFSDFMKFNQKDSFIVGKDSFEDLVINDAKNRSDFYYFKNNRGLIKRFILEDGQQIVKICIVTLIKKGSKFTPRFNFQIWNKTKKAYEAYKRGDVMSNFIKASVNLDSCYENFILLINCIKEIANNVDLEGCSSYTVVKKEDKQILESILKKEGGQKLLQQLIDSGLLTDKDLINTGYRKKQLKVFEQLLNTEGYLEEYKTEYKINGLGDEKVWQHFFGENEWIFGYGLDYRFMTIFDREMSVGDGGVQDQDKPKVDFLNEISDFTVLIEVKTPQTIIFANKKVRAGTWNFSSEFIESYSQVLEQKAEWQIKGNQNGHTSKDGTKNLLSRTRDPKAILIIGSIKKEVGVLENISEKRIKQDTFELFRRDSRNIEIVTYDELYKRASFILENKWKKTI